MLQVTAQTELAELQARVAKLVKQRDETIKFAYALIRETNAEFDRVAVPLGRRINEIRAELAPEPEPEPARRVRASTATLDGLDEDEQEHYRELLAKRKGRK